MNDLSEKEQLEMLRAWWRDNGNYVIGGIVLGIVILAGWHYWQSRLERAELAASALYETLLGDVADGDVDAAKTISSQIFSDYPSTVYAAQTRLALARLYMDKGRDQDAADALRNLLESGKNPELALVARLRLGHILLYQDKPEEVVDLLKGATDSAFAARYSEVLGDAYVAMGRFDEAADAYAIAVADDPAMPTVDRVLIQMKINDLPDAGTPVAAQPAEVLPAGDDAEPDSGGEGQ